MSPNEACAPRVGRRTYAIDLARPRDLPVLASIELAAATLLSEHAPPSVLAEITPLEELETARREGLLWVARADDLAVGFAHVKLLEPRAAHLDELDVHPRHGRRGLGRQLVLTVCEWAASRGLAAVTLSTFRDPPWNMPFYSRLGFEPIAHGDLSPAMIAIVADETARGLDPKRRVVMRRRSG